MIEVTAFAVLARRFCRLLDGPVTASELAEILAELHLSALRLPDLVPDPEAADDAPASRPLPLPPLPFDAYWMVFDVFEVAEPVAGSLADDLADIRANMLRGLHYYDTNRVDAACWEWRFHFGAHWGAHLVNAQRALFCHLHGR